MAKTIAMALLAAALSVIVAVPAGAAAKKNERQVQAGLTTQTLYLPYRRTCGWTPAARNPQVFTRQEAYGCFSRRS